MLAKRSINILILLMAISLLTTKAIAIPFSQAKEKLMNAKRVALYVGSFDPIHLGHQTIIESTVSQGFADYVLVVPNNMTLHKPNATPYEKRRDMLEVLYIDHPSVIYPDRDIETYYIGSGLLSLLSHIASGTASISSVLLQKLLEINPGVGLVNVTGTDVVEKQYMRLLNGWLFRNFKSHVVSIWTDAPESANAVLPKTIGRVPVQPMYLSGLPRISSSKIRGAFASGKWPDMVDERLKEYVKQSGLYTKAHSCKDVVL